jgi:hypothetical protein
MQAYFFKIKNYRFLARYIQFIIQYLTIIRRYTVWEIDSVVKRIKNKAQMRKKDDH